MSKSAANARQSGQISPVIKHPKERLATLDASFDAQVRCKKSNGKLVQPQPSWQRRRAIMEDAKGPKGYHDIGGDLAGDIPRIELPWLHWEKQVEAIRGLLGDGTRRMVSLDEVRRGFESFGVEKYNSLSFYRRRLEAMTDILIEKGIISRAELDAAIAAGKLRWTDHDGEP
jgi:hypothetical protein